MTIVSGTDRIAASLLMLSFFLPQKWQVYVVMGASVYFIFRSVATKSWQGAKGYRAAALFSSLFLIYFAAVLLTPDAFRKLLLHLCERKVSLLFTPFLLVFIGATFRKTIAAALPYFVLGCVISCAAANTAFVWHYINSPGTTHALNHVAYRIMFEQVTGIHPTYMGMFLAFAMCIVLSLEDHDFPRQRIVRNILFYTLFVFLLALLVKSAVIAMLAILCHYAYRMRTKLILYWRTIAVMITSLLAAALFIPFIGQRSREVLSYFGAGKPGTTADNSVYVRKLIFDEDLALVKANWLVGVGPGRVIHSLQQHYFFYSLIHGIDVSHYDPHSEYFNEWLGLGIGGLLILVAVLIVHIRTSLRAQNYLYLYLVMIIVTTFFTETVLSRQEGVLFFALFTSLFYFKVRSDDNTRPDIIS